MSTHAKRERLLLADLLETAGPDAPTLCEGWRTRDLAAHVVVRERRADAAGGIMIKQLAPRLERVMTEFAAKPYEELIQLIRTGPPRFSPFQLKQLDAASNTVEFYVHTEDGRRAPPAWTPRHLVGLVIASLVLVIGSFLVLAKFSGSPPGSTYVPAHVEGGKFVPGATR